MTTPPSPYRVIALRWRPTAFADLIGQDVIVRTLCNAISLNRIAHAYLLVGPRGTGKTTTARLLSMALNCENGPSIAPDPNSPICQSIINGSCLDVIEIDGASNNSVDQIRSLREECPYAPTQCAYKIYIIDEVHMLSTAAFNALLKTLEEPPKHVKFILATTEAQKIPQTILSRCQRLEFHLIEEAVITQHLQKIVEQEGITAEPSALSAISRLSGGSLRDAQSILEQLTIFCNNTITEKDVCTIYGLPPQQIIDALAQAIFERKVTDVLDLSDTFHSQNYDYPRTLMELQKYFHRKLLQSIQAGPSSAPSWEPLRRILEVLHEGESSLKFGLSEKINFESTLLKAAEQANTRAIDTLIQSLENAQLAGNTEKKTTHPSKCTHTQS